MESIKVLPEYEKYLEKEQACIICSGNDFSIFARKDYLIAKKCMYCEMISVNPHFSEEGIKQISTNYFTFNNRGGDLKTTQREQAYKLDYKWLINFIQSGRVLDIGCSGGQFLNIFPKNKWKREGIDTKKGCSRYAKENFGIDVYEKSILDFPSIYEYDLVVMRGTIEHLKDPIIVLDKCADIIKVGGYLFITTTPAGDSFAFYVYRDKWDLFDPAGHIHFFSIKLLSRVWEDSGFKLVAEHYQYSETPCVDIKDYNKICNDICLINHGFKEEIKDSPAFPGSILTGIWRKEM